MEGEQGTLTVEFDSERTMMIDQHQREMTELQDIMFAMEQNVSERETDAKSEFQSMRDEIKNKVGLKTFANDLLSILTLF